MKRSLINSPSDSILVLPILRKPFTYLICPERYSRSQLLCFSFTTAKVFPPSICLIGNARWVWDLLVPLQLSSRKRNDPNVPFNCQRLHPLRPTQSIAIEKVHSWGLICSATVEILHVCVSGHFRNTKASYYTNELRPFIFLNSELCLEFSTSNSGLFVPAMSFLKHCSSLCKNKIIRPLWNKYFNHLKRLMSIQYNLISIV